jgi:hypothetical protein
MKQLRGIIDTQLYQVARRGLSHRTIGRFSDFPPSSGHKTIITACTDRDLLR